MVKSDELCAGGGDETMAHFPQELRSVFPVLNLHFFLFERDDKDDCLKQVVRVEDEAGVCVERGGDTHKDQHRCNSESFRLN